MTTNRLEPTAVRSVAWSTLDKWGTRIISLGVILFLGRILDAADFGVLALATAYTAFVAVFVDSGFSRALVQKASIGETDRSTAFWFSAALATALAILTVVGAPLLASLVDMPVLAPVLQFLAIGIFLNGLSNTPAALLEREFRFKSLAMRRTLGSLCGGVAAVSCALAGWGVWSLVTQTLVTAGVSLIVLWSSSKWRPNFRFSVKSLRALAPVGLSVLGIELVSFVNSQADKLLIGAFTSAEQLGYYYMARQITTVITSLFSSVFDNISLATFSRLQGDSSAVVSWFLRLTTISSYCSIPVFFLVAGSAPTLIPFILGPDWEGSIVLIQILSLLGILNAAIMFDRNVLIAVGEGGRAFRLTLGQAIMGLLLLIPATQFGVMGIAIAVVARQYLFWPFRLMQVRRALPSLPLPQYFRGWLVPLIIGLLACSAVFAVGIAADNYDFSPLITLLLQGGTALLITAVLYWFFGKQIVVKALAVLRHRHA